MWQLISEQFQQTSWLEWLGTVTGFACVYLAARQNIWNWPIAMISVAAYFVLFYNYRLYGDALLQLYFFGTSVYGWYYWLKRKEAHAKPVVSLTRVDHYKIIAIILVLAVSLGLFLDHFTDTDVPYADGFCTAMSFTAQYLMTRKVVQNWVLWIIVDVCYVPLYLYKDLALTALLYLLFLGIAVMGYLEWRKAWKLALNT